MPITKNRGRQSPITASVEFTFANIVSGAAEEAIDLPAGAIVTGGDIVVMTAFNSATSDVIVVGDSASANRYYASASIATAGRNPLVITGYRTLTTTNRIRVTWTGSGAAPTAGAIRLTVTYIVDKRVSFSQG